MQALRALFNEPADKIGLLRSKRISYMAGHAWRAEGKIIREITM